MLNTIDIKYFKQAINGPYQESAVDIAAKCPICGDSKYKTNVKRLHLYERNGTTLMHCFNGDCSLNRQMSLGNFLKFYKPELHFNYKNERFRNNLIFDKKPEIKDFNFDFNINNISDTAPDSVLVGAAAPEYKIKTNLNPDLKTLDIFKYLSKDSEKTNDVKNYLKTRGFNEQVLDNLDYYVGVENFNYNGRYFKIKNFLVIPFIFKNKIYGFYSRSITEKQFINFSANPGLNVWNLFNVDLDKPVLIFEAILDALSFKQIYNFGNIIALNTNNISLETLKLIKYPVFCFDNDKAGITKMIEYVDTKNSKFLIYPEDLKYKDFNDMLLNNIKIDLKFESGFKALLSLKKLL